MDELELNLKDLGLILLKRDLLYHKIPTQEIEGLIDFALGVGEDTGEEHIRKGIDRDNPLAYIQGFCTVNYCSNKPDLPIFSETITKNQVVNIYCPEIETLYDRLKEERLDIDINRLYNIFLLHEFFHIIEEIQYGYVSKMKKITVYRLFSWKIKRGISQLSEIAANSFVRTIIGGIPIDYISDD